MASNIERIAKESQKRKPRNRVETLEISKTYGAAPIWTDVKNTDTNFNQMYARALNWANASFEAEELKQMTIDYLTEQKDSKFTGIENLPNYLFGTVGKIAWMMLNDCPVTPETKAYFNKRIVEIKNGIVETVSVEVVADADYRQQKHLTNLRENIFGLVEDIDVQSNDNDVYNYLTANEVNHKLVAPMVEELTNKMNRLLDEITTIGKFDEPTIIQEFDENKIWSSYMADLTDERSKLEIARDEINSYLGNKKALRKTRNSTKRPKNAEKLTKNVKFKLQDSEYKISSIPPASVVGAQTLIAFNSKNRKLAVYVAASPAGLSIRGTTIQNLDEAKSTQKTVKKPNQVLKDFQNNALARARVLYNSYMNTRSQPANGRINEHTILIRVFDQAF